MGLFRKELKQREALPFLLPVHVHSPHSPSDVKSLAHAPPRLKARLIGCTHTRTAHIAYTQRKRRGPYAVRPLSLRPPSAHSLTPLPLDLSRTLTPRILTDSHTNHGSNAHPSFTELGSPRFRSFVLRLTRWALPDRGRPRTDTSSSQFESQQVMVLP